MRSRKMSLNSKNIKNCFQFYCKLYTYSESSSLVKTPSKLNLRFQSTAQNNKSILASSPGGTPIRKSYGYVLLIRPTFSHWILVPVTLNFMSICRSGSPPLNFRPKSFKSSPNRLKSSDISSTTPKSSPKLAQNKPKLALN